VLIGYLPAETLKWEHFIKQQNKSYLEWRDELIIKPELRPDSKDKEEDHPLNTSKNSMWNKYFRDQELWEEIEKDVRRTRSDLSFFTDALDPTKR